MKNLDLLKPNILNFLICLFPLMPILGNLLINIQILSIIIFGILIYQKKLFSFNKNHLLIFISFFFIILIFSTILEDLKSGNDHFIKSVLYLRYLLLLIIIRCMILNGDFDFKQFLISCLVFSTIVAADVIFQYFLGVNILGFESSKYNRPGLFGTEAVAGGYIQRFLVLGLFSMPLIFYKNKNSLLVFLALIVTVGFLGIVFSGNRMSALLFIFFILLSSIIFGIKKFKFIKFIFIFSIISFFAIIVASDEPIRKNYRSFYNHYNSFYAGVEDLKKVIPQVMQDYPELEKYKNTKPFYETEGYKYQKNYDMLPNHTGHTLLYITSIDVFKDNPIIGRGIKSFRNTCREKWHLPNRLCQLHPHHFYLEILNDTGIVGFIIIGITLISLFIKNFKKFYKNREKKIRNIDLIFYAVSFALIIEFIPFRSHGSFFSTTNSSYIFFLLGIFYGLYELKLIKSFKKGFNF